MANKFGLFLLFVRACLQSGGTAILKHFASYIDIVLCLKMLQKIFNTFYPVRHYVVGLACSGVIVFKISPSGDTPGMYDVLISEGAT